MAGSPKDAASPWQRHWRAGFLSSLSNENETLESVEGRQAWNAFFAALSKGARVLDLCTGNGIVPALANAFSQAEGKDFTITGIDFADIDPLATLQEGKDALKGVTFKGGVNVEVLPFEDASFDAVTGQYAIEYADTAKAIAEVFRVLARGGRFRFVLHAAEGAIVAHNTPKARQFAYILDESGVFGALEDAVTCAFKAEDQAALDARTQLRDAAVRARAKVQEMGVSEEPAVLLENLVRAYITRSQYKDAAEFRAWLNDVKTQVQDQVAMISSFEQVALTREGLEALEKELAKTGFAKVAAGELRAAGDQLHGWTLAGEKP